MRYVLLIATICCVVIPVNGQKTATKPDEHQKAPANTQPPKNEPITVDTVNVNTLNVAKQTNPPDKTNQNTNKPPTYFRRLIAPENLPTLILCIVGAAGVIAAIYTYCAIRGQARIMAHQSVILRHQTKATVRAAEAASASVKLQRAVKAQGLNLENWNITNISGDSVQAGKHTVIGLSFDVVNPTDMPLQLKHIEIFKEGGTEVLSPNKPLAPTKFHSAFFKINLSEQETTVYFSNWLRLHIFGTIAFRDNFGERKNQIFGHVCAGGVSGFQFSEFEGWLNTDEEDDD